MAAWYHDWFNSPYYHKLYFHRDEEEARAFLHRLLRHLTPAPASRMLDVACGRGRHSRMLAAAPFDVTGFDLSPESIAYAKQYEQENLHFYIHDMRLPFCINYFDYAFNLFTSFGYFATRREHNGAMRSICQNLKPGGTLVFDYLNATYAQAHLQPAEVKTIDGTTFDLQRWQDETHFYKRIQVSDVALAGPLEFTEKVAKFSHRDFTEMLSQQQMQVTDVFGTYQLQPFSEHKSPRLILVAKRMAVH